MDGQIHPKLLKNEPFIDYLSNISLIYIYLKKYYYLPRIIQEAINNIFIYSHIIIYFFVVITLLSVVVLLVDDTGFQLFK